MSWGAGVSKCDIAKRVTLANHVHHLMGYSHKWSKYFLHLEITFNFGSHFLICD